MEEPREYVLSADGTTFPLIVAPAKVGDAFVATDCPMLICPEVTVTPVPALKCARTSVADGPV